MFENFRIENVLKHLVVFKLLMSISKYDFDDVVKRNPTIFMYYCPFKNVIYKKNRINMYTIIMAIAFDGK
jgi:hypothetical protein